MGGGSSQFRLRHGARALKTLKRGNGEGSIYANAKGVWTAVVSLPGGRRKYLYAANRHEVARKLALTLGAVERGALAEARGRKLGEYLDQWLRDVARPSVREWTYRGYEVHVRCHIKPLLGHIPLDRLAPADVQYFLNGKLATGLSPKTVRYMRGTLRTALHQAVRWNLIATNAAAMVDGPRIEPYEYKPFSRLEARRFLAAVRGHRLEALYTVALAMGLRQGEALGLRWQDVDLDLGYIRLNRQLQRFHGRFELVQLKTARSRRTLVMPPVVAKALRAHRDRQIGDQRNNSAVWNELGLVFTRADGKPLDGTVVSHQFHRILDRAELPQRRFHDLRHSCATLLIAQHVSPRVVMEILGHSQIGVTMNTYAHVIPEQSKGAAKKMESLLAERDR